MKYLISTLALGACMISPAMAQSNAPTFTGPHASISVGLDQGTAEGVLEGAKRERQKGVSVRGDVGYDLPIGNSVIVGAELGVGSGGRDIKTVQGTSRFVTNPGVTVDATARLGFKPVNKLLIFGKAGWAFQRVKSQLDTPAGIVNGRSNEHGVLWGAGTEWAITPNISLRSDFDRVSFSDHYKRTRFMSGVSYFF
jgi:outer membrane autotransporter protein